MDAVINFFKEFSSMLPTIKVMDIVDILVVAFLIYKVIMMVRSTSAARIAKSVLIILILAGVTQLLNMYLLNYILDKILEIGLVALIVVFQPELRRMLEKLGSKNVREILSVKEEQREIDRVIEQTVQACEIMAKERTGVLIVFERSIPLLEYQKSGTVVDACVSSELLRNLFFTKASLHDGAVIIRNDRIAAAGCVLPLTENHNISSDLGTRHRAGIGISEVSDAVVVIVSEETGTISVAISGMLKRHLAPQTLEKLLLNELAPQREEKTRNPLKLLRRKQKENKDAKSKILAFLLALVVSIVLWFYAVTVVNPDDTITISGISVQFEGTEALTSQGLMLTGGDSTKVSIKVSGRRSDLKELNNETVTAIADVTRIAASGSYQLSWSVVWPSTVATGDISETSRAPSRISVTVSDIKENPEVPVELEYTGEPKTGYMIDKSNLTLGTQSISVRGPAEEVNKIARAVVRVDVTDADALIDTDCPVVLLDKDGNELSLSQYVTSSADSVRVTIPILQYKDIKLNATLISGGGATSEDAEVTIEPSTLRVTGNTAVLDAMADELTIRTIDLAQITGTETFEVTPELPSGVTSRADSQTVKITVTLKGLVTKEFTVPTANILRKEAPAGMTFADQNVKITVRGRASVMSSLRMEDLTVTADFSRHYDAAAKQVELEVALPANVSAGVIGGPYTVQVSLSETDGGNTES